MRIAGPLLFVSTALVQATVLYTPSINAAQFRETIFAGGLSLPLAMLQQSDGSLLVQTSPGFVGGNLLRFTSTSGVADGAGTSLYTTTDGPLTQLEQAGNFLLQGNAMITGADGYIAILAPGATLADPRTEVARLQFDFTADWWHPSAGFAVRPTPGAPAGFYDLVFNVGSEFDNVHSNTLVGLTAPGLGSISLQGESLYMVTLDLRTNSPVVSNVRQVATGIRNVFGIEFDPITGDLYFVDNAIDGDPFPPQADELNRILAADLGVVVHNFGFPTCYPDYATGVQIGSGCTAPLAAFSPANGVFSQGPTQIAFAPLLFPSGLNNGLFIGFAGIAGARNPVLYYDFTTGQFIPFIGESALGAGGRPLGIYSTADSLFISTWGSGQVIQFTSATPEPGSLWLLGVGLSVVIKKAARISPRRLHPTNS